jgi:hypothetical protein
MWGGSCNRLASILAVKLLKKMKYILPLIIYRVSTVQYLNSCPVLCETWVTLAPKSNEMKKSGEFSSLKEPINFAHFCPCVYFNLNADEKEGRRGNISEETLVFLAVFYLAPPLSRSNWRRQPPYLLHREQKTKRKGCSCVCVAGGRGIVAKCQQTRWASSSLLTLRVWNVF